MRMIAAYVGVICAWAGLAEARPTRIVSLDLCADQYLLAIASPDTILALSPDAQTDVSYFRDRAAPYPSVAPRAEAVSRLKPDLVVRTYGGGPRAEAFFTRTGVAVHTVSWVGTVKAADTAIAGVADLLERPVPPRDQGGSRAPVPLRVLYITPGGITTGPGSYVHDLITQAGHTNYITRQGWQDLPLEHLVTDPPDVIVTGFYGSNTVSTDRWSVARHPRVRELLATRPTVHLDGRILACAGWGAPEAISALAAVGTAP